MSSARKTRIIAPPSLDELRSQIDQVDTSLVALLERRAQLVFSVGELKRQKNLPIYDAGREDQIRARVGALRSPSGPLSPDELGFVFMNLVERFRMLETAHGHRSAARALFPKSELDFSRAQGVVLWGFGLMGSSFYLALNEVLPHWTFFVIDPQVERSRFLQWRKFHRLTNIKLADEACLDAADLVVLGAPVEINSQHLATAKFGEGTIVFDLGSTKTKIEEDFLRRRSAGGVSFKFVGGHPLAGKEVAGFENGDALLFYNKVFCWVPPPSQDLSPSLKATFDALALCVGARPLWLNSNEHDQALAWTSHLPQIVSSTLADQLLEKKFADEVDLFPGYISEVLRISGSPFSRWKSIFSSNSPAVRAALGEIIQGLEKFQDKMGSLEESEDLFEKSNKFYRKFKVKKQNRS